MNIRELRDVLKAQGAKWTPSAQLADTLDVKSLSHGRPCGAVPPPPGANTEWAPRIRVALNTPLREFDPKTPLRFRKPFAIPPKSWDWRAVRGQNWITPVKNQGGCGSCVAFAAVAAIEAHWRIQNGNAASPVDLSEAALFFTNDRQCNAGDPNYGWWVPAALDFVTSAGECGEVNYPYQPQNQVARLVEGTDRTYRIQGYDSTTSTAQMKRWLVEEGPLVTTFSVYEDFDAYFWAPGPKGVYTHHVGDLRGGHAVLTVGYDDNESCWICKNNWGSDGGDAGFFRIGYGQCSIDARMYLIQDIYENFTRDEIRYNPLTLRVVPCGPAGWLLTDGHSRLQMFDTAEDARNGLCVARRHTRQGFIGRENRRADRIDYITQYWTGVSGLYSPPLTKVDALPYAPANVVAEDINDQGWRIKDGAHWMLLADDFDDALAVLQLVERHSKLCFIGRDNRRPNRKSYIMTYFE
jgi:hypothetical protein